jgi:hypothetical protein
MGQAVEDLVAHVGGVRDVAGALIVLHVRDQLAHRHVGLAGELGVHGLLNRLEVARASGLRRVREAGLRRRGAGGLLVAAGGEPREKQNTE